MRLDHALLDDVGLGDLAPAQESELLDQIAQVLQFRIGSRLSDQMNLRAMLEFEQAFDLGSAQQVEETFDRVAPSNYRAIVEDELETIAAEIRRAVEAVDSSDAQGRFS